MLMLKTLLAKLNFAATIVGSVLFLGMSFVSFFQVIMRYCFSNALSWPEEASRFMFIWVVYLSMAYGMHEKTHLKVDAFVTLFSQKVQDVFEALGMFISVLFTLTIAYYGYEMIEIVKDSGEVALTLPIPLVYVWMAVPVCFLITGAYALLHFCEIVRALFQTKAVDA